MDYFYSPFACSFTGHLLIREAGLPITLVPVSLLRKQDAHGNSLEAISSKNHVPVLRFDDGRVLTEVSAILQVLADMAPQRGYLPPRNTLEGQRTLEWLSFAATEVHKVCLYPFFQRSAPAEVKAWAKGNLAGRLAFAAEQVREQPWLAGEQFTVADAYMGWALSLAPYLGFEVAQAGPLADYWARLLERPAFTECLALEESQYKQYA